MKVPVPISRPARRAALVALAAVLATAGCQDPFGNRELRLPAEPLRAALADFRTGDLDAPSAFQLSSATPVRPHQTSNWDFVYWVSDEGEAQFRPRTLVVGDSSEAGLNRVESSLEGLQRAPADGYVTDEPVPIDSGAVYAVRSRQDPRARVRCRRFGKLEVTGVDPEAGTVEFRHLVNPNCEDRNLKPDTLSQQ